jgi:hypothetical protein
MGREDLCFHYEAICGKNAGSYIVSNGGEGDLTVMEIVK